MYSFMRTDKTDTYPSHFRIINQRPFMVEATEKNKS